MVDKGAAFRERADEGSKWAYPLPRSFGFPPPGFRNPARRCGSPAAGCDRSACHRPDHCPSVRPHVLDEPLWTRECRIPDFSACRIVPGADFRHSASPSNRKWRCFSGPRECPAFPRRFPSSRDPSTPASHARPGATGGSWIPPGTETRTPTGRRGCSLDSPLAESGPERRPAAGPTAARRRIPLPAWRRPVPYADTR